MALSLDWFHGVNKSLGESGLKASFFGPTGLFSPPMGRATVANLKVMERSSINWSDLLRDMESPEGRASLKSALGALLGFFSGPRGMKFRRNLYKLFAHNGTLRNYLSDVVAMLPQVLREWGEFRDEENDGPRDSLSASTICEHYHHFYGGRKPLPRI